MITLAEVCRWDVIQHCVQEGYIRQQFHPAEPLAILNYTHQAAYDNLWNDATKVCRGLIYNLETLEVVARPFPKFFNWGQPEAPVLAL